MTTKTNLTQQEILKDLGIHAQVCLAMYGLFEIFSAVNSIRLIFDVDGIVIGLQFSGFISKDFSGTSSTGKELLPYIYPIDSKVKSSERLDMLLCILNPVEKAYLVAKAIFAKNGNSSCTDSFFGINAMLYQLKNKDLLTTENYINDDGNTLAILICREVQEQLNLETSK